MIECKLGGSSNLEKFRLEVKYVKADKMAEH